MLFVQHRVNGDFSTVSTPPRLVHPLNAILVNDRGRVLHFIASMDDLIDGTVQKYAVMDLVWQTSAKVLSNR